MRLASSPTRKNTKKSHLKCKKFCVNSDSNDDEPEEERTVKAPTIRVAIQMVDELMQFAQDSLENEEIAIFVNLVWRLLQEKRLYRLKQKHINDYLFEQMLQLYKHSICRVISSLLK